MSMHGKSRFVGRMLSAAACLCAGAAVSVGVSWWIAARGKLDQYTGQYSHPASQSDLPRSLRDRWPAVTGKRLMPGVQTGYLLVGVDAMLPGSPGDHEGERLCTLWSSCFGWPMPAMRYLELPRTGGNLELAKASELFDEKFPTGGALEVPEGLSNFVTSGSRLLPGRIMPLGFAVDSAMYGGVLWGLLQVPMLLRRRAWIRDGKCGSCGYELGTLARCPECGRARSSRRPSITAARD